MRTFLTIIPLFFSPFLQAQDSVTYFSLKFNAAEKAVIKGIQSVPFKKVEVLDNRFDTVRLRMVQDGKYPVRIQEFDGPASRVIAGYLQDAVRGLPAANRTLVLDLQQFRFGNSGTLYCPNRCPEIRNCLFMYINAYISGNGEGLYHVCSFREPIFFDFGDLKYLTEAVRSGFHDLLKAIETATPDTAHVFQLADLKRPAIQRWAAYPVNRNDSTGPDGIYQSFDDFLADKVKPASLLLNFTTDSVFTLAFEGRRTSRYRQRAGYPHIWGVRYHGRRYIGLWNPYIVYSKNTLFLPLESKNNTFYFYVPGHWPNIYSMFAAGRVDFISQDDDSYGNRAEYNQRSEDQMARILKDGLTSEHRDCFLDMDSGDIIYN